MVSEATAATAPEPIAIVTTTGKVAETVASSPHARGMWAALSIRDYRLLWWGMVISNIGTWMQMVAQGYLVYDLTHSPLALGAVGLMRAIPVFTFSLFAGVLADRVDRRKLLIVTQSLAGVLAFVLAVLTSTGHIQVWMIMCLAFCSAAVMSFDNPTRQALIPDIVGREYMSNAIALNSAAMNGTGVIGPSLAGIALAAVGAAACFYINAVSFIAVIAALWFMASVENRGGRKQGMWQNLKAGFGYVRGNAIMAALLVQIGVLCFLGRPYTQLMPAVQRDVLHASAAGLGILMACNGVGALAGALAIARLSDFKHRGTLLVVAIAVSSVALIAFALSTSFVLSCVLLVGVGGGATVMMSTTNMLIQNRVPDELRGRVMSMYTMIIMGGMPLGGMALGSAASFIGVPETLALGGVGCLICLAVVSLRVPAVRKLA